MAQLLETLRSSIIDSIKGRKLGLDLNGYVVGVPDVKRQVTDLTSASTGTSIPAYGFVGITGTSLLTSAQAYLLSNPVPGVEVTIANLNADSSAASPGSTALTMMRPSTAFVIKSSEGTTMTTINLAVGNVVKLLGLSTGVYQVSARSGTAGVIVNGTT